MRRCTEINKRQQQRQYSVHSRRGNQNWLCNELVDNVCEFVSVSVSDCLCVSVRVRNGKDDIEELNKRSRREFNIDLPSKHLAVACCFASNCEIFALAFRSCRFSFSFHFFFFDFGFDSSYEYEANRFFSLFIYWEKTPLTKTNTMGKQIIIVVVDCSSSTHRHSNNVQIGMEMFRVKDSQSVWPVSFSLFIFFVVAVAPAAAAAGR